MIRAIVIDDVADARESLKADLADYCPQVEVVAEAEGVVSGMKLLSKTQTDVVFLDIQMKDGSGFDLLELIGKPSFRIIFTTASDAHAIKAFRFSALDYLLKPIDPEELVKAVAKLENSKPAGEELSLLMDNIRGKQKPFSRLSLHSQDKIHIVDISDIIRCESQVNYTYFHLKGGKKLLITRTLKDYEEMLRDHGFARVHQSHLVNLQHMKEFIKTDGGHLLMSDQAEVPVSTRRKTMLMQLLERL